MKFHHVIFSVFITWFMPYHCADLNAQQEVKTSLLWKLSGNNLEKPSYLYGTVHVLCPEDFIMDSVVKTAFSLTELLVMEVDMDDPQMMQKMAILSINPEGESIAEKVSEAQRAQLDTFLIKNYGVGMQQFGVIKPFFLYAMIIAKMLPCEQPVSFEKEFLKMSKQAGMQVKGLETIEYQISIFDSIPMDDQIRWIADVLEEGSPVKNELSKMMELYKRHDINALYEMIIESPEYEEYVDILLHERNKNWIPVIKELIHKQSTFIAVGAGHLGSEKGVISLLRNEGYVIEPIALDE